VAVVDLPPGANAEGFTLTATAGTSVGIIVKGPAGPLTVTWNGLGDQGQPVAAGSYLIRPEGISTNRSLPFLLLERPWQAGPLTAAPQPLGLKDAGWHLRFTPWPGAQAHATLYDLAGERVGESRGDAGLGQLAVDGRGLSSGIYLVELDVNGSHPWRRRAKLAVLR
jgi:hypothetical protein